MPQSLPGTGAAPLNDYLYVDRDRIAAYHTQLLGSGVPLESKYTETFTETTEKEIGGSVKVVAGKIASEKLSTDAAERTFDQSWPMILATVDELFRRGLIHKCVPGTPVGSIVEFQGALAIVDLRLLHDMWDPMVKLLTQQNKAGSLPPKSNLSAMANMAKVVPHPLVAQIVTSSGAEGEPWRAGPNSFNGWGVLSPQHIIGNPDAFAIMNGGLFPGEYNMIAVLDVGLQIPGPDGKPVPTNQDPLANIQPTNTFEMVLLMQQHLRSTFGRPNYANGVTPLLIYRKVTTT